MLHWRELKHVSISKFIATFFLIVMASTLLAGCNIPRPETASTAIPVFDVEPVFREFYANLGGERYLGPPISAGFPYNDATCQYTANALMCMNANETDPAKRFYLEPLGNNLNVAETPNSDVDPNDPFYVDGYEVHPQFKVVYEQMNGRIYFGKPISNLKINEEKNQYEQYFENVAFYVHMSADAQVQMLPYGYYSCKSCQGPRQQSPTLALPQTAFDQATVFSNAINRMGGTAVFGKPISAAITRPDGTIEQVYETIALYVTSNEPQVVRFRPLPTMVGMPTHPPGLPGEPNSTMVFYAIQGKMEGYNVPIVFDHFIKMHGGRQYSGDPISHTFKVPGQEDQIYGRQCFMNYCLDYMKNVSEDQAVRVTPLGSLYSETLQPAAQSGQNAPAQPSPQTAVTPVSQTAPPALQLLVSEMLPKPGSSEYQTLSIAVFQAGNSQPVAGIQVVATITPPTGNQQTYTSTPTNANGNTVISFPPPPGAKHGDVITYQVCITGNMNQPVCQFESYLIWDLD